MIAAEKPVAIQPVHDEDCECPLCRIYRYPNKETIQAIQELENGEGTSFVGTIDDFFNMLDSIPDEE